MFSRNAKIILISCLLLVALCYAAPAAGNHNPRQRSFHAAQYCARHGHYRQALRLYSQLLPAWSQKAELHIALGDTQLALGNSDAAQACYRKALELNPKSVPARLGVAKVCAAAGNLPGAYAELEDIAHISPCARAGYLLHSQLLRTDNCAAESLPLALQAAQLCPGAIDVQTELASVYLALGRQQEAVTAATLAVQAKPTWWEPHVLLAQAYQATRRYQSALSELNTAGVIAAHNSTAQLKINALRSEIEELSQERRS
jgi:protein O-GlcNAc transferase